MLELPGSRHPLPPPHLQPECPAQHHPWQGCCSCACWSSALGDPASALCPAAKQGSRTGTAMVPVPLCLLPGHAQQAPVGCPWQLRLLLDAASLLRTVWSFTLCHPLTTAGECAQCSHRQTDRGVCTHTHRQTDRQGSAHSAHKQTGECAQCSHTQTRTFLSVHTCAYAHKCTHGWSVSPGPLSAAQGQPQPGGGQGSCFAFQRLRPAPPAEGINVISKSFHR